jgi:hypothetical protein
MPPLFKPQQRATLVNNKSGGIQRTQSVASHAGQARAGLPLRLVALAASSTGDFSRGWHVLASRPCGRARSAKNGSRATTVPGGTWR